MPSDPAPESFPMEHAVRDEVKRDFAVWLRKHAYAPATFDQSLIDFGTLLKKLDDPAPLRRTFKRVVRRLAAYGAETGDLTAQTIASRCEARFVSEQPSRIGGRTPRVRAAKSFDDASWTKLITLIRATAGLPARVLEVMSETGLRINDTLQIRVQAIRRAVTNNAPLTIVQKGATHRPIDLHTASNAWGRLLAETRGLHVTNETTIAQLISPNAGRTTHGASAPYFRVGRELKRLSRVAGIEERVFTHRFRHTFATRLADASGDIYLVRDALGHTNVATTEIYAGTTKPEKIAAAVRRISVK